MRIYIAFTVLLISVSCNKEKDFDCFKSTGPIQKETRSVNTFTKINLLGHINLIFVESAEQKIEIEAGKHLIPKISTKVLGDSLILENNNYCDWVRSYKKPVTVYIYGNPNMTLYNNGFGTVGGKVTGEYFKIKSWSNETMNLEMDVQFLWLETFKLGNTFLRGNIQSMQGFRHMTGIVNMKEVNSCPDLIFHDHGQGLSFIKADSALTLRIFDTGSVEIYGKPTDIKEVSLQGSGKVLFK
jgi:hypothetical protein